MFPMVLLPWLLIYWGEPGITAGPFRPPTRPIVIAQADVDWSRNAFDIKTGLTVALPEV